MTLNKDVALTSNRSFLENGPAVPAFVPDRPSSLQTFQDAFLEFNSVVSLFNAFRTPSTSGASAEPVDGFDPFEDIEGTIFEDFPESLIRVNTPEQKVAAGIRIQEELDRKERLSNSGVLGFVASMAAGVLDPLLIIPIGGQVKTARSLFLAAKATSKASRIATVGKAAFTGSVSADSLNPLIAGVLTARAGLIGSTASETVLQATQETRTLGESVFNVTADVLLSGILGSAVGQLSKRSRKLALRQLNDDLSSATNEATGLGSVKLTEQDLVVPSDGSATGAEIKLQNALGIERLVTLKGARVVISPFVDVLVRSKSREAKRITMELVDSPVRTEGITLGSPVEAEILAADGLRYEMLTSADELYTRYRTRLAKEKGQGEAFVREGRRARRNLIQLTDRITGRTRETEILSKDEFMRLGGSASRSADSGIPEVDEIGKLWDERVYKPILDDAIGLGLLPEEVAELGPIGARRYLKRIYLKDKLVAEEPRFKDQKIRPWLRGVIDDEEIDGILKKAGVEPRVKTSVSAQSSDGPKRPALDGDFTPKQRAALDKAIELRVDDIFEHLTGSTRGRIPFEQVSVVEGSPFKARALTWDDADISEFLENHLEVIGETYLRTIVPDLALVRKFGSVDLEDQIDEIARDYIKARAVAKTPKERLKIQERQVEDKKQILGMVALLRGTYNIPTDSALVTVGRGFKTINALSMGGGFALNSIPDIGMIPMRNGLIRSFRTGYIPFVRHLGRTKLSTAELRRFGAAIDLQVDTRSKIIADVGDDFARNRVERGFQVVSSKFFIANLLAPWNSMMKGIAGNVSMTRMIEAIIEEGSGKISARELSNLEFARLTPRIRKKIRKQLLRPDGMTEKGSLKWSNTRQWDDLEARQEWGRAVRFSVDNTILTPGAGAVPLWLSGEAMSVIFQFQRFGFGAVNTLALSALQTRDLATMNGLAIMFALGGVVEWSKNQLNDRPNPEGIVDWTTASIDRSGLLGAYGTFWNMGARALGKDTLSSRFAARNLMSSVAGPTAGTAESASRLAISALSGEFNDADLRTARRLMPFNQIPYVQGLFDEVEDGVARSLNLPRTRKRKRRSRR